ncbi:mas-related G-protein coupled receptor member X1-like [Sarcophilus harrisii]
MTVSPTPEHRVHDSENSTKSSSGSLNFAAWLNILSLLIALLGLVGNCAVLWLLGFRIRRTPFTVYILNLAAADALLLCFYFLISINSYFRYFFDHLTRDILSFLTSMYYTAGLSLLAAISTERCLSTLFPIWYRCHRPKHTSAAVCAVLWALAGMFTITYIFLSHEIRFIIYAGYFLLLMCVMCVSSLTLLLRVQCSSRRRQPPRLYLLVLLTVLVFLLCGLPWGIWSTLSSHFHVDLMHFHLLQLLVCVNSSVNPLIYFFVGRLGNKGRQPLKVVLQRALGDEQELGDETTNTPHISSQETSF